MNKTIKTDNGVIAIKGNNRWLEFEYKIPEWMDDGSGDYVEPCFKYKGQYYFLSEFTDLHNKIHQPNPPTYFKDYNGIFNFTYFSGLLIKMHPAGDAVQVFYYYT